MMKLAECEAINVLHLVWFVFYLDRMVWSAIITLYEGYYGPRCSLYMVMQHVPNVPGL